MNSGKSLFWLLCRKIVYPTMIGFLLILSIGISRSLVDNKKMQDRMQTDLNNELRSFVELQYFALHQIEIPLDATLRNYCEKMRNGVFAKTANIENADLKKVMIDEGMDTVLCNLFIINRNGIVINSTSPTELYADFSTFGPSHISYLNERFKNMDFGAPSFFFDSGNNRYVKYCYMPTLDGKYIIEIGSYSPLADAVYSYVFEFMSQKTSQYANVIDINQYALTTKPKSFNFNKQFPQNHYRYLYELQEKGEVAIDEIVDRDRLKYTYLYLDCIVNNQIYNGIIIGIVSKADSFELMVNAGLLIRILLIVIILTLTILFTYYSSGKMEKSIRAFAGKAQSMSEGLDKKPFEHNIEIVDQVAVLSHLASSFNKMLALLESRDSQIEKQALDIYSAKRKIIETQEMVRLQKQLAEEKILGMGDGMAFACNIQQAMLQSTDDLHSVFPESFLFLKSKASICGDYYWFSRTGNKIVVVVADCSGHGIEASFVSVLNVSLLDFIVNTSHIDDPLQILARLHSEQETIYQEGLNSCHDYYGVDVSICSIDLENNMLSYAGANGRIVMVSDGILHTYKGNDVSLGKNLDESQQAVLNAKTIDIKPGDAVYMLTNGYLVQFNSDESRKFGNDAFCNLIKQISSKPMEEQFSVLNDSLNEWQGDAEQTDDILVLGFRY